MVYGTFGFLRLAVSYFIIGFRLNDIICTETVVNDAQDSH